MHWRVFRVGSHKDHSRQNAEPSRYCEKNSVLAAAMSGEAELAGQATHAEVVCEQYRPEHEKSLPPDFPVQALHILTTHMFRFFSPNLGIGCAKRQANSMMNV